MHEQVIIIGMLSPLIWLVHPNLSNRQVNPLFPSNDSFEGVVFHAIALTQNQHITRIE
jgi:hypothetical protein